MIFNNWIDSEKEKIEILELTKKTFGNTDISNSSYFDWQYRNNPNGKAIVILAQDDLNDNVIIGTNTIIPTKLLVEQEEILSSLACNVQVNSKYQNQGIFSELLSLMTLEAKNQEIMSLFAIPNDNSFNSFIKEGSIEIFQLPLLLRPLKFSNYFNSPFKKILKIFEFFYKIKVSTNNVEEFNGDFQIFEKLFDKLSKRVSILQKRNSEYLKWRYLEHPTRKYQIYVLKNNDELIGYIIIKLHTVNNKKIGVILDYVVDSTTSEKLLKTLIHKALDYFWKNNASVAISTCGSTLLETKLLKEEGFFNIPSFLKPEPLHFIVKIYDSDEKLKKLTKYNNWFFTFGDYDVF